MSLKRSHPPIILISQRVDEIASRNETRDALDQALSTWVCAAGAIPLAIPNVLSTIELNSLLEQINPQGIILSGGNNIGCMENRDQTETALLNWSKQYNRPLLGICRGMQMIGVWAGCSLMPVSGHTAVRHEINGKLSGHVNSFHDYALCSIPEGFKVLAVSKDGHIEAIESSNEWLCEGWMWHPEREVPFNQQWLKRFKVLMGLT